MNNKSNKSPLIKWLFMIFGIFIGAINAVLTAVFSYTYLPAAFGRGDGLLAPYLAALYGLLIMDIAYLAWFYVFLRLAESKGQRSLSITMAVLSLGASIMATITQLATNSFGLVDLTDYSETVGITAMVFMIGITALHIISFASYTLLDPEERIKTQTTNLKAEMLDDVLVEVKKRVEMDKTVLVDATASEIRRQVLSQLGFTENLLVVGGGGGGENSAGRPGLLGPVQAPDESEPVVAAPRPVDDDKQGSPAASSRWHSGHVGRYHLKAKDNIDSVSYLASDVLSFLKDEAVAMVLSGVIPETARIFDVETGQMIWWYMEESAAGRAPRKHDATRPTPANQNGQRPE